MITPQRAPVKPRVVAEETGDSLLLEDFVATFVEEHHCGAIEVLGEPVAWKTHALAHLATLPCAERLALIDDASRSEVERAMADRIVVYTAQQSFKFTDYSFRLADWSEDDLIEYLLASMPT